MMRRAMLATMAALAVTASAAQITDDHIAKFAVESTWDGLADALTTGYGPIASRIVLYNALSDPDRIERYGAVAQRISAG